VLRDEAGETKENHYKSRRWELVTWSIFDVDTSELSPGFRHNMNYLSSAAIEIISSL
jgi:hypothetical protein